MKILVPITVLVGATWAAADYSRDSKDTRLSFSDFNNWSLPRLRTGSKRKENIAEDDETRRRTPELKNYLPLAPPAEKKDYMKFESSLQGEECEVPNPIEHGYDGIRRRGYEKVTEGVFCNKGAIEGSRCFLMCEKGARLENSGRKRFKCKCSDGKCKWSINIEETICKEYFCSGSKIQNGRLVSMEDENMPCDHVKAGKKCMPKCNPGFKLYRGSRVLREATPAKCYCPKRGMCGFRRIPMCIRNSYNIY